MHRRGIRNNGRYSKSEPIFRRPSCSEQLYVCIYLLSVSYTFAPNFLPNLILRAHVSSEFLRYYVLSWIYVRYLSLSYSFTLYVIFFMALSLTVQISLTHFYHHRHRSPSLLHLFVSPLVFAKRPHYEEIFWPTPWKNTLYNTKEAYTWSVVSTVFRNGPGFCCYR